MIILAKLKFCIIIKKAIPASETEMAFLLSEITGLIVQHNESVSIACMDYIH